MKIDEFEFPGDLKYMKGHIWVKTDKTNKNKARLGITSLGSSLAKEIVHVDLPENNDEFESMEPMASFETIKSVTEITAPFDCKVTGVNEKLLDDPSLINTDPYGGGWILDMEINADNLEIPGNNDNSNLMDIKEAAQYYEKILNKEKERYKGIYD